MKCLMADGFWVKEDSLAFQFASKSKQPAQHKSFLPPKKTVRSLALVYPTLQLQRTIGNQSNQVVPPSRACDADAQRITRANGRTDANGPTGHDFSQIPIFPDAPHGAHSLSGQAEDLKLFDPGPGGVVAGPREEEQPDELKNSASTSGAKIEIKFDPASSTKANKCDQIVHTQVTQLLWSRSSKS